MTVIDRNRGADPPAADKGSRGSFKDRLWNERRKTPRASIDGSDLSGQRALDDAPGPGTPSPRGGGDPQAPRPAPAGLDDRTGLGPGTRGQAEPRARGPRIQDSGVGVDDAAWTDNSKGWYCDGWNGWNGSCSWSGSCGWPSWPSCSWNWWWGGCSPYWFSGCGSGFYIGFGLWPFSWGWCDPWWPSYSPYSWPSPRYSYWDGWGYTPISSTSYTTIYVPESHAQADGPPPCPASLAESWAMLAGGDPAGAQAAFECLADRAPGDGLALVGLAAASAIRKDDLQAVAAMRQALRDDPESLSLVPTDDRLTLLLADAATRFQERARKQYGDVDALVMTGALSYLRREMAEAHYAVEVALALDPADASARNLQTLIEQQ